MSATAGPATAREPLARRLWRYQRERFPVAAYVPLIATFTFSSAAYSRLARGARGFIDWPLYAVGTLTALTFFFTLRVLDEHKDADVDRRYRPELPVPRGLVSLAELRRVAGAFLAVVLALNAILAPVLLLPCLLYGAWATLMTKEFFVRDWLRAHLGAYLVSHMLIMPMIDAYTTGLDWLVAGRHRPPHGVGLFLAVTFLNGALIEVGRKLHAPEAEREGVDSYTRAWGLRLAPFAWLGLLAGSGLCAWAAAHFTHAASATELALVPLAGLIGIPAIQFLVTRREAWARRVESASGLWSLGTYLILGAGPFVLRWLGR